MARAQLAAQILRERLDGRYSELRIDLVGSTSLHGRAFDTEERPYEVRLRVAARAQSREEAAIVGDEVEALYTNGPAGGGGTRKYVNEQIGIVSTLIDRARITDERHRPRMERPCRSCMTSRTAAPATRATRRSCRSSPIAPEDYPLLAQRVTVGAVAQHLRGIVQGDIRRLRAAATVGALQFVCEHSLAGGVTTSLALDAHGKSLSFALLEMEI